MNANEKLQQWILGPISILSRSTEAKIRVNIAVMLFLSELTRRNKGYPLFSADLKKSVHEASWIPCAVPNVELAMSKFDWAILKMTDLSNHLSISL